jgi:hypothetical protein
MIQTLTKNWWLLALSGLLEAIVSVVYLILYDAGPDGPAVFQGVFQGWYGAAAFVTRVTLAAGLCTIVAGLWRSASGKSWLLVLNGLALTTYGLLPLVWRGPLSFDLFALLIVVSATAFGILALAIARRPADKWIFAPAGVASISFALAFVALVTRSIQLERRPFHPAVFLWLSVYFAFSAICIFGLALRFHTPASPLLGNVVQAH